MFSGIVEDIGTVVDLNLSKEMRLWDGSIGEGVELTVSSPIAVCDATIGCSIAVNGVCLTAITFDKEKFTVGLAPETLRRTNLGQLTAGSKVNVERALPATGRNSGHFVQGHVDCTASILARWSEGDSLWFRFGVQDEELMNFIVTKGFVCIDGVSLTVCDVNRRNNIGDSSSIAAVPDPIIVSNIDAQHNWFTIMLVPHTQQHTILALKQPGEAVNIEVDVLGKLVAQRVGSLVQRLEDRLQKIEAELERSRGKGQE
eukprot:gene27186-32848_t